MFDTYVTRQEPRYPQTINTTINENKAPTDASIDKLDEMYKKVRSQIVDTFPVENCPFEGQVFICDDPCSFSICFVGKFVFNGRAHQIEVTRSARDFQVNKIWDRQKIMEEVVGKMVGKLVRSVFSNTPVPSDSLLSRHFGGF